MSEKPGSSPVLDALAFAQARGLFTAPSLRLPAEAVQSLATEVIGRLSHRHHPQRPPLSGRPEIEIGAEMAARIEALARALVAVDDAEAAAIVEAAHAAGETPEDIYLGLLAEAARLLGRWWEEDEVSSLDVVLGAGRLYALMRGLRRLFRPPAPRGGAFHALFASAPGETHSIGVTMAADLMTRRGWEIDLRAGLDHEALLAEVRSTGHAIIGLSASAARTLFPLARLIVGLRLVNPAAWVLVSGRIVELEPQVAQLVDADAAAADLTEAAALLEAQARRNAPNGRR